MKRGSGNHRERESAAWAEAGRMEGARLAQKLGSVPVGGRSVLNFSSSWVLPSFKPCASCRDHRNHLLAGPPVSVLSTSTSFPSSSQPDLGDMCASPKCSRMLSSFTDLRSHDKIHEPRADSSAGLDPNLLLPLWPPAPLPSGSGLGSGHFCPSMLHSPALSSHAPMPWLGLGLGLECHPSAALHSSLKAFLWAPVGSLQCSPC